MDDTTQALLTRLIGKVDQLAEGLIVVVDTIGTVVARMESLEMNVAELEPDSLIGALDNLADKLSPPAIPTTQPYDRLPGDPLMEIERLRSMIAGHSNGFVPASRALAMEADAIRKSGNDGRAWSYPDACWEGLRDEETSQAPSDGTTLDG
jgi:hypothetical protein